VRATRSSGGREFEVQAAEMRSPRKVPALIGALLVGAVLSLALGCEGGHCSGAVCPEACSGDDCGAGAASGSVPGRYESCSSDSTCDTAHGFSCVEGNCLYACDSHFDCAGVGLCRTLGEGTYCSPEAEPSPAGTFYTSCPSGHECDEEAGYFCVGAGSGDLDAYCTTTCADDAACPTGYFCESSGATPCEDACDVSGDPTDPKCVPASAIGDGQDYQCTARGVERYQCVKRRFCAECETDEDCRSVPGLICARDEGGAKICTPICDPGLNSCPWGNAAICGLWDEELGVATCSHRFGACKGSGAPCEPCTRDRDCGETGLCYGSSFTGERYCIDLDQSASCSCSNEDVSGGVCEGGGCPLTPGGLEMLCYVGSNANAAGICFGANSSDNPLLGSPQTGCWGPF
jgi:hypothetical protein